MSAHTPGPWFAVQYNRSAAWRVTTSPSDAHGDIANVLAGLAARKDAEVAANAKLIAAAPDLLESLREVLNLCAIGDVDETTEAHGWGAAIKAAKQAVEKATS